MSQPTPLARPRGGGKTFRVLGDVVTCIVEGQDTANAWSLFEVEVPTESGPPLHFHEAYDEALYVLEGELEVYLGDKTVTAGPGQFFFVPRGTPHGFRNRNASPARFLSWATPSGAEHFFAEMDRTFAATPPDMEKVLAIAARHRTHALL